MFETCSVRVGIRTEVLTHVCVTVIRGTCSYDTEDILVIETYRETNHNF
jgi:hypothetical protein